MLGSRLGQPGPLNNGIQRDRRVQRFSREADLTKKNNFLLCFRIG